MGWWKFLSWMILLTYVQSQQVWDPNEPFLANEAEEDRVQLGDYGEGDQLIWMNENIEEKITIAYLNYKGPEEPKITKFTEPSSGSNTALGAVIERTTNDENWRLVITIKQDYEGKDEGFKYVFDITVTEITRRVYLYINNIDDEAPIIILLTNPCEIEENKVGVSQCYYTIRDADGVMNGVMEYSLTGPAGIEALFEIKDEIDLENEVKEWTVVLNTLKCLDFESSALHLLDFVVSDSGNNKDTAKIIVHVTDMPDQPPVWKNVFSSQQFDEKTKQIFQVEAIDGDVEIDYVINYKLTSDYQFFHIEETTGTITVDSINRDELGREIFTFTVTAFELPDPNSFIDQRVTVIVNDINDNVPIISVYPETLIIPENTATKLELKIEIKDMDLGDNGTYKVSLRDDTGNDYQTAFQIVPDEGYQISTFTISVVNSDLLDYEVDAWQEITIEIHAQEKSNIIHFDSATVKVSLENLNDEYPIFEQESYTARVFEDIGKDTSIATVFATDRDINDLVKHSLIGKLSNKLFTINEETGEIKTLVGNAFDYETETEVVIQVQAEDSLLDVSHRVTAQLVITVEDVNDEPPRITAPPNPISIKENQADGAPINTDDTEITATDEDTTADLIFRINWEESYATKNGQLVEKQHFETCINVQSDASNYADQVKAVLTINEIAENNTPDYEKFDKLFIMLVAEDQNQKILPNTDKVIITINIEDVNDNAPIFDAVSINSIKRVTERASSGTPIATIIASDADGPEHNKIKYSISPADSSIPGDWIGIDPDRGELFVKSDEEIDADGDVDTGRPPFWTLAYIVTAINNDLSTEDKINIQVTDINDNPPIITVFNEVVNINEHSPNNTDVQRISVTDSDRDEAYNTPWFRFGSSASEEVKILFSVDSLTGRVYVNYKDNRELDRDKGTQTFSIPIIIVDNLDLVGGAGQNVVDESFMVILLDINNQPPTINEISENLDTSENILKGSYIGEVQATDDDEPGTDNTKMDFTILKIEKGEDAIKNPHADLFTISTDNYHETGKGILTANYDLRDFYGTYDLLIKISDFGANPKQYWSEKTIHIHVSKYNFLQPIILFPSNEQKIYLEEEQTIGGSLIQYGGQKLEVFYATDSQTEKWDIVFKIDEASDNGVFTMASAGKSRAQLVLVSQPNEITYTLNIVADCNCSGDEPFVDSVIIYVRFMSENSEPYFTETEINEDFPENCTGLDTRKQLPKAYFQEGEEWDQFKIYYELKEDDSGCFKIDAETALLELKCILDRENHPTHTLKVAASKNPGGNNNPDKNSILTVFIKVLDENDNPPNFESSFYYAGVKPSDELTTVVLEVTATDLDLNDTMIFSIVEESFETHGNGIDNIKYPFDFKTENDTFKIVLNFSVQSNMNGYFLFNVAVLDEAEHSDTATIKIYVVSDSSRTAFKFENNINDVELKKDKIKTIIECVFCMCNIIETIQKSTNENGETVDTESNVIMHFFDSENEPIDSTEIEQISSDIECFATLRSQFLKEGLYLLSFTDSSSDENMEEILRAWLIGVSVVLGALCVVLTICFIGKTRSLVQRLNNLSTTKFGSQESGLNRMGIAAPNTNKHAIEGSNPVYNDEKRMDNIDTASIGSGDSDLIGIEDNPNFEYVPQFSNETIYTSKEKF